MNYIILDTLSVADSTTPIEAEEREGPPSESRTPEKCMVV